MEDFGIIELFWKRSQEAITQLNIKYGPYCYKIAWNILYNREDSEECVSDTNLKAWNSMPPQRPGILRAFLGRITRNLALNRYEAMHARKRGSAQTSLCLDELAECIPGSDTTEEIADRMTLRDAMNAFLGGLKEKDRKVFVSRYWYMMPVGEIASTYGLGESGVKMTLKRLRDRLRVHLEGEGFTV